METLHPIPGYPGYTVTACGSVYYEGRLLKWNKNGRRSVRVSVKNSSGKTTRIAVAKLIALACIPNPHHYSKIIFKDRNKNNCTVDNIRWVSPSECTLFAQHTIESDGIGKQSVYYGKESDCVQLKAYPGYSITADGKVFMGNYPLKSSQSPGRAARVKVKDSSGKPIRIAIAKLIALAFIPNPNN